MLRSCVHTRADVLQHTASLKRLLGLTRSRVCHGGVSPASCETGGTILGTSIEHRLHPRRRHQQQHTAGSSGESEPPSPGGSTTDEDEGGGGSSSSSSNGAGRRYNARSGSPVFATYEDRLEAVLDK